MKADPQLSKCYTCESEQRFLHNVRHRGAYLRLCSLCVLKSHPELFCPNCLEVYTEDCLGDFIKCLKCCSVAHSTCVPTELLTRYLCPNCSKPGFSFSDFERTSNKKAKGRNGEPIRWQVFDLSSARVLLAAARIASRSMNRAAAIARVEAEKRVKEAAFARKKAREAIENVFSITAREKEREKECSDAIPLAEHEDKLKAGSASPVVTKQPQSNGQDPLQKFQSNDNNGGMEGKEKVKGSPVTVSAWPQDQNRIGGDEKEKNPAGLFSMTKWNGGQQQHVQSHAAAEERKKCGAALGPVMQQQHSQNLVVGEHRGMLKRFVDSELQSHVDALKQLRVEDDGSTVSVSSLTGVPAAGMKNRLSHSSEDAPVSMMNSGIISTGSPNTGSLLS